MFYFLTKIFSMMIAYVTWWKQYEFVYICPLLSKVLDFLRSNMKVYFQLSKRRSVIYDTGKVERSCHKSSIKHT